MKIYMFFLAFASITAQFYNGFQIARLKYKGGGDWYNDPSAEINLLKFVCENTNIKTIPKYTYVDIESDQIYSYPFLFLTGHGNLFFTDSDAKRLRDYLEKGGFLYVDDDLLLLVVVVISCFC